MTKTSCDYLTITTSLTTDIPSSSPIVPQLLSRLWVPAGIRWLDGRSERRDRAALLFHDLCNQNCDDFGYSSPGHERFESTGGKNSYAGILRELEEIGCIKTNHRFRFRSFRSVGPVQTFRKKYKVLDVPGEWDEHEITSLAGRRTLRMMQDEAEESGQAGWLEHTTLQNLKRLKLPGSFEAQSIHEQVMASQFQSGQFLGAVSRCRHGRLHSPLTRTERRIRSLLQLDGNPDSLVEIDVSCCQPLLLAIMAGDQRMVESCGTRGFYDEIRDALTQPLGCLSSRGQYESLNRHGQLGLELGRREVAE